MRARAHAPGVDAERAGNLAPHYILLATSDFLASPRRLPFNPIIIIAPVLLLLARGEKNPGQRNNGARLLAVSPRLIRVSSSRFCRDSRGHACERRDVSEYIPRRPGK